MTSFNDLGLAESLLRAVRDEGYHTATPIQLQAIPPVLAPGNARAHGPRQGGNVLPVRRCAAPGRR